MLEIKDKKVNETILSLLLKIWTMAWELWCLLEKPARRQNLRPHSVHCSLQTSSEDRTNRRRQEEEIYYKEPAHTVMEADKSKIHRVTWQARDTGRPMVQLEFKADRLEIRKN